MKDHSIPDARERKKITFYDTEKRQVDLRTRLRYDGMNQSQFFRAMITGYLEKNDSIIGYVMKYKEENSIQSKNKRAKSKKIIDAGKKVERQFALRDDDIEDIFDLLEQEHPEL